MVHRKRSLEEYDDDYKPLSKRLHSMYLKDGPVTGDNCSVDTNLYGVSNISCICIYIYNVLYNVNNIIY